MSHDPRPTVLALNSGSSSLKFGLYRAASAHLEVLVSGEAEFTGNGNGSGQFRAADSRGTPLV